MQTIASGSVRNALTTKHRDLIGGSVGNLAQAATAADVTTAGGGLAAATAHFVAYLPASAWGIGVLSAAASVTTSSNATANHSIRTTIPQCPNATIYHLFIGTGSGTMQYVGTITEAQRAAGGFKINAYNAVIAGAAPAGSVDIGVLPTTNLTPLSSAAAFSAFTFWGPDKLQPPGFNGGASLNITLADVATGGTLAASTTYSAQLVSSNRWGSTTPSPPFAIATAADGNATHGVRVTVPADANAEFFDLFLVAANAGASAGLWAGRITAAQLAAGGARITAFGVVDAAGAAPAGAVDIMFAPVGSTASNAGRFASNSAHTPQLVTNPIAGLVNQVGYNTADLFAKWTFTAGAGTLVGPQWRVFKQSAASPNDWFAAANIAPSGTQAGISTVTLGSPGMFVVLLDSVAVGEAIQDPKLWVELIG